MKYFLFLEPLSGPTRSNPVKTFFGRFFRKVLPNANPDFEEYYKNVREWWFEIDDGGVVVREIGFDENCNPIVAGPLGENMGLFTDAGNPPNNLDGSVDKQDFERAWSQIVTNQPV